MTETTPMYTSSQLNDSTYLIIHNDKYYEFPYIYAKVYEELRLAVIFDTGCGPPHGKGSSGPTDLKDFIVQLLRSSDEPGSSSIEQKYRFLIVCTHCHFDHIGGIESFAKDGATILASGYDEKFNGPANRSANSLCEAFGMSTPSFNTTHLLADGETLEFEGTDLALMALHTPGHTPDSLAVYDKLERWLFTGDTCYKRVAEMPWGERQDVPIVFPIQGDWKDFKASIQKLRHFVSDEEANLNPQIIRIACGHTTSDAPAAELLRNVAHFAARVEKGEVPVIVRMPGDQVAPGGSLGSETFVLWQETGDLGFSMIAPESFETEFSRT